MSLSHEITRAGSLLPLPAPIQRLDPEAQARYLASALYGREASLVHVEIARLALLEPRIRDMAPSAVALVRDTELAHGPAAPPPFLHRARVIQARPSHRLFGDVNVIGSYLSGDALRVVVGVAAEACWHGRSYQYRCRPGGSRGIDPSALPMELRSEAAQVFRFLIVVALLEEAADSPIVTGPPDMPAPPHPLLGFERWIAQPGRLQRGSDARWVYRSGAIESRNLLGGRCAAGRS